MNDSFTTLHNTSFNIGDLKADNATVNLGGTVEGAQIVTQYTFPETLAKFSTGIPTGIASLKCLNSSAKLASI